MSTIRLPVKALGATCAGPLSTGVCSLNFLSVAHDGALRRLQLAAGTTWKKEGKLVIISILPGVK